MTLSIQCPTCNERLFIAEESVGMLIECPKCGQESLVQMDPSPKKTKSPETAVQRGGGSLFSFENLESQEEGDSGAPKHSGSRSQGRNKEPKETPTSFASKVLVWQSVVLMSLVFLAIAGFFGRYVYVQYVTIPRVVAMVGMEKRYFDALDQCSAARSLIEQEQSSIRENNDKFGKAVDIDHRAILKQLIEVSQKKIANLNAELSEAKKAVSSTELQCRRRFGVEPDRLPDIIDSYKHVVGNPRLILIVQ